MEKVAAIQLSSSKDVSNNLKKVKKFILKAFEAGAKFIIIPENSFLMSNNKDDLLKIKEFLGGGKIQDFMANLAATLKVWIVGGTLPIVIKDEVRVYAACIVWNSMGEMVACYNKINLFNVQLETEVHSEADMICPGKELVIVPSPAGCLGLSICYDIRFPELYGKLALLGAEIIMVSAAFTYETGKAHWEILLRARAIENFCFVVAANQVGKNCNSKKTYGHSMIISPWGEVLNILPEGEGFIVTEIDLKKVQIARNKIPSLQCRQL